MNTKILRRTVRGLLALLAFWFAAQHYAQAGFTPQTAFVGGLGVLLAFMAASGKG